MKKLIVVSLVLLFGATTVAANESIRIVVGLAPGGTTDLTARAIAKYMQEESNVVAVVENRPGAESKIAVAHLNNLTRRGEPAVLVSHGSNLSTVAHEQLMPLTYIASAKTYLATRSDSTLTASDLCSPGRHVTVGVGGHLTHGEIFLRMLPKDCQKNFTIVTYKSGAPAVVDLVGGHIDMFAGGLVVLNSFVEDGRLRLLSSMGPLPSKTSSLNSHIFSTAPDVGALYIIIDKNMDADQVKSIKAIMNKVVKNKNFTKDLANLKLHRSHRTFIQNQFGHEISVVQTITAQTQALASQQNID